MNKVLFLQMVMMNEFQSSAVLSMIPELLLDIDKTLQISRQIKLERGNSLSKICEQHAPRLVMLDHKYSGINKKREEKLKSLPTEINEIKKEVYSKENEIHLLRSQIQAVKITSSKAVLNVPIEKEISYLTKQLCILKEGIEFGKKAFKEELAQHQKGIFFYKKYFSCNVIHVPKETLIFTPNSSAKTASDASEYIKFSTKDGGHTFEYLEMQPKLRIEQALVKRYQETKDIQGFILYYIKALKVLRTRKVLSEKN